MASSAIAEDWYTGSYYQSASQNSGSYQSIMYSITGAKAATTYTTAYSVALQVLYVERDVALAKITAAAEANDASSTLTLSDYQQLNLKDINTDNVALINSALDSVNVDGSASDSCLKLQSIIDSYNKILAHSDGISSDDTAPGASDYTNLGLSAFSGGTSAAALQLMGQVLDVKTLTDINTFAKLQAIVDAIDSLMEAATGTSNQPTLAELHLLEINQASSENLSAIQAAIAASNNNGSDVDTLSQLRVIALDIPTELDLTDTAGINLCLINPVVSEDGKVYFALDVNNNGSSNSTDYLTQTQLYSLFNDGTRIAATQNDGAVEGVDDARTIIVDGYTLVLPTLEEFQALFADSMASNAIAENWYTGSYYQTSSQYNGDYQSIMYSVNGSKNATANTSNYTVAFQVLYVERDAALEKISTAAQANNAGANVLLDDFQDLHISGVNGDNLAVINDLLDSALLDGTATDSWQKVQDIVDSFLLVQNLADGISSDDERPVAADYINIGLSAFTGSGSAAAVKLMGQALDIKTGADIDSFSKIQAIADAVQAVMDGASGTPSVPTLAQLQLLGVSEANTGNLSSVQSAIAASVDSGVDVDTLSELRVMALGIPTFLDLTDTAGISMYLIKPVVTEDGKVYFFLDEDADNLSESSDSLNQNELFALFNSGSRIADTQSSGAVEGVDDARTVIIDGYTIVLPSSSELQALYSDSVGSNSINDNWYSSSYYQSSSQNRATYQDIVNADSGVVAATANTSNYRVAFQILYVERDAALTKISAAAGADDAASNILLDDYQDLNIVGVNADNLAPINSILDSSTIGTAQSDTYAKIQSIADSYNLILALADELSSNDSLPSFSDYETIGLSLLNDVQLINLLGQSIDLKSSMDVSSHTQLQVLVDAAQSVMDGAAGSAGVPSVAELNLLGIEAANVGNIVSIQTLIAATNDDGSGVQSLSQLKIIAAGISTTLDLTDTAGINLHLIEPVVTADGKVYYYLDLSGNGSSSGTDTLNHNLLDTLLNGGTDTQATQSSGAIQGVDDARTVFVDGYTLILPTKDELVALYQDQLADPISGWSSSYYWSADQSSSGSHNIVYMNTGNTVTTSDDTGNYRVTFQVFVDDSNTALTQISDAAENDTAISGNLALASYLAAGIQGVTSDNLNAINSLLDSSGISASETDSIVKVQDIVDSYLSVVDSADGVRDGDTHPTQAQYSSLGLTDIDSSAKESLLGDVIDAASYSQIDSAAKLQALASAVSAVMSGAAGGVDADLAQLQLLGIEGVSAGNLSTVQSAIDASLDDGSQVDTLVELQGVINQAINSDLALIASSAQANTAASLNVQDYIDAGISNLNVANLAAINSVLDSAIISADAVDTQSKLQTIVDTYNLISSAADSSADGDVTPSMEQYQQLGLNALDSVAKASLFSSVIDTKAVNEVDSFTELAAIADAITAVFSAAAGTVATPSLAQLQLLGITATANDLQGIQAMIAGSADDGSQVSSLSELQQLADSAPASVLDLTDTVGINLHLIDPVITSDGKVYFYLDRSGDDANTGTDTVTHALIDQLLNSNADTLDTQLDGAVEGVDDQRTIIIDGYTLVLPTQAELLALFNDPISNPPDGWASANYWSSSTISGGNHYQVHLGTGSTSQVGDNNSYRIAFQVLYQERDAALEKIVAAAQDNDANSEIVLTDFEDLNITGVDESNLNAILSVLDDLDVQGADVDSYSKVQGIVDSYNSLLALADGISSDDSNPLFEDYQTLGVSIANDPETLQLLAEVIDEKTAQDIDSVIKLQALADAVSNVMSEAAGLGGLNLADLNLLGVTAVNAGGLAQSIDAGNLVSIKAAIAASSDDGSDVDTLSELRLVANEVPNVLDITDTAGVNLHLINPIISADGKLYYYVDHSGDGSSAGVDTRTHSVLDALFNSNTDTLDTQIDGAAIGIDDERTVIIDGYTIVLPTRDELLALHDERTTGDNLDWDNNYFWSSTSNSSGNHYTVQLDSGANSQVADSNSYRMLVQVFYSKPDAPEVDLSSTTDTFYHDDTDADSVIDSGEATSGSKDDDITQAKQLTFEGAAGSANPGDVIHYYAYATQAQSVAGQVTSTGIAKAMLVGDNTLYDIDNQYLLGSATVQGDGSWSMTMSETLSSIASSTIYDYMLHVSATRTDSDGNISDQSAELQVRIDSREVSITTADPLIIDLNNDGVQTLSLLAGVGFDHNGDGAKERSGWVSSEDALLVLDLDSNGTIDSGLELFGDETRLANGERASDGFMALAQYDDNNDGIIDASDAIYQDLQLWQDSNSDGKSESHELFSLLDLGVSEISLSAIDTAINQQGNEFIKQSSAVVNGEVVELVDVNFATVQTFETDIYMTSIEQVADNLVINLSLSEALIEGDLLTLSFTGNEGIREIFTLTQSQITSGELILAVSLEQSFTDGSRFSAGDYQLSISALHASGAQTHFPEFHTFSLFDDSAGLSLSQSNNSQLLDYGVLIDETEELFAENNNVSPNSDQTNLNLLIGDVATQALVEDIVFLDY